MRLPRRGGSPSRCGEPGFEAVECPLVRIEWLPGPPIRSRGLRLARAHEPERRALRSSPGSRARFLRIAVVGPGTAEALREQGLEPSLVARRSSQEGLVAELPRPRGPGALRRGRGRARRARARARCRLRPALPDGRGAARLRFPTSISSFWRPPRPRGASPRSTLERPCVAIGPQTAAEARGLGLQVAAEAEDADLEGLVAAVRLAASRIASSPS